MDLLPVLNLIRNVKNILIAGCGGGFDVYAGIPLAMECKARGQNVVLANLSFTDLPASGAERVGPALWAVGNRSSQLSYFPEHLLSEWMSLQGYGGTVYAIEKTGVRQTRDAFEALIASHKIELVVLIDGGTDSVIFGDEPGLGTVTEDAVSLVAAHGAARGKVILSCAGFGIDHHHGVSHFSYLENVSQLMRLDGFLGSLAPAPDSDCVKSFLDLVEFANARQPQSMSIVNNSIACAFRGEFGDYHATGRTAGSELFINPLMTHYWFFDVDKVVGCMTYAADLAETTSFAQAQSVIESRRQHLRVRPRRPLPL